MALVSVSAPAAHAENNLLGGIGDLINGALSIPVGVLAGTMSGPPVIGTVRGAVFGTLNAVSLTTRGALRLVGVVIPLAARLAPLLPIFL
jgi:hypothetical protein